MPPNLSISPSQVHNRLSVLRLDRHGPASGLIAGLVATDDVRRGRYFFEHLYFEHDADNMRRLGHMRPLAEAFAEAAKEPDERQAYTVSRGISHQLRLGFVSGQELWGTLLLFRGHGSLAFTREERELLGRLGPRLGAGLRAAVLRRQVATDADEPGMPGILVLDRRGRVAQYTMAAERWLQELAELPADWRDGEGMPAAVYLAIGALRSALHGMRGRTTHIDARTRTGGWLRLQATLTEGERDAEVMIVIEPLQSRDLVWLRTAVYNLTKREQEVVDLVMRGSSNCRIAETLFISEYTVQDHLSHILDKVGVCTRRALVKQLYLGGGA